MSNNFVYIISHHYFSDDWNYPPYCDLYKIYKTEKEAFEKLYYFNNYTNHENYTNYENEYHFKVVKYRINTINENDDTLDEDSKILYDSYKHIINENLEIIEREVVEKETHPQVRRLNHWTK
jgi:hypothetical protein